jgi:hypothetical protein
MNWTEYLDGADATLRAATERLAAGDALGAAAALEDFDALPLLPALTPEDAPRAKATAEAMQAAERAVTSALVTLRRELTLVESRGAAEPIPLFVDRAM